MHRLDLVNMNKIHVNDRICFLSNIYTVTTALLQQIREPKAVFKLPVSLLKQNVQTIFYVLFSNFCSLISSNYHYNQM